MTIKDRIEHIRQCVRRMKPTMGFELAAVEEIEKELVALETIAAAPRYCPNCRAPLPEAMLEEMIRNPLSGDNW